MKEKIEQIVDYALCALHEHDPQKMQDDEIIVRHIIDDTISELRGEIEGMMKEIDEKITLFESEEDVVKQYRNIVIHNNEKAKKQILQQVIDKLK